MTSITPSAQYRLNVRVEIDDSAGLLGRSDCLLLKNSTQLITKSKLLKVSFCCLDQVN